MSYTLHPTVHPVCVGAIEKTCFPDAWKPEEIASIAAWPYARVWEATDGDTVLGYLLATDIDGEGEILRIATHPDARRQGIGHALLSAWLDGDCAPDAVYLEVRAGNAAARRLYQSVGFVEVGLRKNYYRQPVEDAVLMSYVRSKEST